MKKRKSKYSIIDNFLSDSEFVKIKDELMGKFFPWYCLETIAAADSDDGMYFTHKFYDASKITSKYFELLVPMFKRLETHYIIKALIRGKANCYLKTNETLRHDMHRDLTFKHNGLIYSINNCNGATILEDGTQIPSKANRMLLFDSSRPHCSTSCTDEYRRVNLNFNYF